MQADPDPLEPVLDQAGARGPRLERAQAEAILKAVSTSPPDEFIEAFTYAPGMSWADGQGQPDDYLQIHNRSWSIDISEPGSREHLLAVVVAVVIADVLRLDLSVRWVARVWPGVLTVLSARRDDGGLHFRLARQPAALLPPHLADIVNPDDFAEFAVAVRSAAGVLPISGGGTVTFLAV